jgi:hypothetical protein
LNNLEQAHSAKRRGFRPQFAAGTHDVVQTGVEITDPAGSPQDVDPAKPDPVRRVRRGLALDRFRPRWQAVKVTPAQIETGRTYGSSEPVMIRVTRRGTKLTIDDDGAAVRLAGRPPAWLECADRVVRSAGVNVNRRGVVFVPAVGEARLDHLVALVAATSPELYDALLDER